MNDLIKANAGLLVAGVATFMMMGAGSSLYGPALPAFGRELGLTAAEAGWLVSTHWIGCAAGVAAMYRLGAMITPRMAVGLMALGALLLALGLGVAGTFLGALLFGAGYGCSTVVINPRILRAFGSSGTAMLSLLNATFGIGAILAPLAFVWVGSDPALAFAGVAVFAGLIILGSGAADKAGAATTAQSTGPFRPRFGLLCFAVFGIGLEACLIGLGPTALIAAGEAEDVAAQLLSGFFVAFLSARVLLVFAAHLFAPFTLYLGAMAGAAVMAVLAALVSPGVFFVGMGLSAGLFFPSFYVVATKAMGDDSRVAPTIIAAGLLGGIVSPILLGLVMDQLGKTGFFWIMAAVAGATALAAAIVSRRLPELRR